jgi:hypothetical protein
MDPTKKTKEPSSKRTYIPPDRKVKRLYSIDVTTDRHIKRLAAKYGIDASSVVRCAVKALECRTIPPEESITLDYGPDR